jgi:hypothetical protein
MTFRLVNHGLAERWLRDEYLYHVWHPNESGINTDYQGPHDGRGMSLRALEARVTGRAEPSLQNPWIGQTRQGRRLDVHQLLRHVAERDEPTWHTRNLPIPDENVFLLEADYHGFNLFRYQGHCYGLKTADGAFDPRQAQRYRVLLDAHDIPHVKNLVNYYNALPKTWLGRLGTQPLHQLPWRAARKIRKEFGRLFS